MRIDDNDTNEIMEEVHRTNNFDKNFDICLISECGYGENSNENEEESSREFSNKEGDEL